MSSSGLSHRSNMQGSIAAYTCPTQPHHGVVHRHDRSWRTCMPTDRTTPNIARLSRERMCSSILCSTIASQEPSRFLLYAPAFYLTLCSCVSHCASAFRSTLLHFTLLCAPAFQTVLLRFRRCSCVSFCAPAFDTVLLRFALCSCVSLCDPAFHTVLLRFSLCTCVLHSLCSCVLHCAPAFCFVLLHFMCSCVSH